MDDVVGLEVEPLKPVVDVPWRKLGCGAVLALLAVVLYVSRSKPQFSGHFEGPIEGPVSDKIWMKLELEHIGTSIAGKVELTHTYGQRYVTRTGQLRGQAGTSGFAMDGKLNTGELLQLTGSSGVAKDKMQLQGEAKLPNFSQGMPFVAVKKH